MPWKLPRHNRRAVSTSCWVCSVDASPFQEAPEHGRDDAFTAHCQGRGGQVRLVLIEDAEGGLGEAAGRLGQQFGFQGRFHPLLLHQFQKPLRCLCIGADFRHGGQVVFEMAGIDRSAIGVHGVVGFLLQHQLVDEVAQCRVALRQPGYLHGGDAALQVLEQGHEVPDRVDVVGHEQPQIVQALQVAEHRVSFEFVLQRGDVFQAECGHGAIRLRRITELRNLRIYHQDPDSGHEFR